MNKSTGLDAAGEPAEPTCDSDKCYICLSLIKNQTVGSLDKCLHVFCLQCILQWSQTANTCPVDRISFAFIHQRRSPAGVVQKQIRVTPERKDGDDEEEGVSPVICEECGRSDRRHRLLLCARCDSGFHVDCLTLSLNSVPEGDWTCPECVISNTEGFGSEEEEISNGELTELLAEVDRTSSPRGRLRASTLNRPGGLTQPRRSSRIQSRGGGGPRSRPQTCRRVPKYLLRAWRPTAPPGEAADLRDTSSASVGEGL
ncbi:PHD and RING finger domain-containing protein 1 isoform X1 [Kryptolebias marmoratus]|uniref:PHD and RING finger domain-containing protein 1 isoform X1 n=1 Tax=Kryptolebias marmoratus TaxID=37003 RepID=UPI0007F92610|nr:PHD and RING finger domain-containing protein 1 isoform X1 [Kryptolebias marmoratus]